MSDISRRKPKVSVIMAVYNGEKYIGQAIDSILDQTLKDFELVVVDDGSTDTTADIVNTYTDPRIQFFQNSQNRGSVFSRNRAVRESSGQYLAILDSDDIAMPRRLEMQSDFLDTYPDFGLIGSAVQLIDGDGKLLGTVWKNMLPAEMIHGILLFQNYFANSSTMFRREALPDPTPYREKEPADDYDLWSRIDKKWKMWNLPNALLKYRVHEDNMSTIKVDRKNKIINQIMTESLAKLQLYPTEEELKIHRTNYGCAENNPTLFLDQREQWLERIKKQNDAVHYYEQGSFNTVLIERWLASSSSNTQLGFVVWRKFWRSPLSRHIPTILWPALFRFSVKCLLRKQ